MRSNVVNDGVIISNNVSGTVNNASDVIDVCGDVTGTMGGASDGSTKNGPDTEHLMKMTTPTKGESTERLHRRTRQGGKGGSYPPWSLICCYIWAKLAKYFGNFPLDL